ncbi:ArgS-related anticodon-binding protein NrtL [Streptomyces sp. CC219B]|uniref:ArgS-related anticodon-binding protein NrtL n=1 Tax=Streptomyces sp. CC219B TaxID=3044574 RepID=UPI0024A7DAB4|nr:DALR anticodon-binding domain-containing protein [Streptomyces sp. CC219B]
MTPVELSRTVLRAVRRAVDDGELSVAVPERAVVTAPGPGGCGDYATNIALQLARPAGQPPRRVAEILRPHLVGADGVADVVVTGPGFINFSLRGTAPASLVAEILRRGPRYGCVDGSSGSSGGAVRLHCAHDVRAVVVMDVVARLLRSQGALVHTSCDGPVEPEWEALLGVSGPSGDSIDSVDSVDACRAGAPDVVVRPAPAPADPLPLGRDAARWALLHPAAHDRPRITDEHLVQREGNPLFRIRYAYARTRAVTRNAADLGFTANPGPTDPGAAPEATAADALVRTLADHPRVVARAAAQHAPDRLARHLVTVADGVLAFLPAVLPRGAEKPSAAHRARLALAEAAGAVLAGGLSLLGIDAPEHL